MLAQQNLVRQAANSFRPHGILADALLYLKQRSKVLVIVACFFLGANTLLYTEFCASNWAEQRCAAHSGMSSETSALIAVLRWLGPGDAKARIAGDSLEQNAASMAKPNLALVSLLSDVMMSQLSTGTTTMMALDRSNEGSSHASSSG